MQIRMDQENEHGDDLGEECYVDETLCAKNNSHIYSIWLLWRVDNTICKAWSVAVRNNEGKLLLLLNWDN